MPTHSRSTACPSRCIRRAWWRRGRHSGRCVLRRVPGRARSRSIGSGRCQRWARRRRYPAYGPAHRDTDRDAEGYIGVDVHRGARVCALAHGRQIVAVTVTAALLNGEELRYLGEPPAQGLHGCDSLFQLGLEEFPPLRTPGSVELPTPATDFLGPRAGALRCGFRRVRARPAGIQRARARRHGQDALCPRALPPARRGRGRWHGFLRTRTSAGARSRAGDDRGAAGRDLARGGRNLRARGREAHPRPRGQPRAPASGRGGPARRAH